MKTIILCGGIGTRLKEETEYKPKAMVQVGQKPILWHIMKIYSHHGYNDFVLALGHKAQDIKDYFSKTDDLEVKEHFKTIFADTGLETPHGERVLKAKEHISEDMFMVTYGDGVANIDIGALVAFHKSHGKMATITGVHPSSKWGLVNAGSDNLVTEFAQKPLLFDYVNGGFMIFNKEFFDFIKPGDMIEDSFSRLIPEKQLAMYKHEGFWYGMDTYKDFLHLNELWQKDPKWKLWKN